MTVTLPDVSEFQSPASGNAPNWAGIKSQNGGGRSFESGTEIPTLTECLRRTGRE
jgi:hypothetical protein